MLPPPSGHGRSREILLLLGAFDQAVAEGARGLLLTGEPGPASVPRLRRW